ncbi:MAG: hemerythrin domain-containing protein [Micropruina sp.]|nr:hemerythrin domain-containing protein [Micropruina sp.]
MCNYCGCENIGIIGRFMTEHVEIINEAGRLRRAHDAGDAQGVADHCRQLAALLHPHTTAEEVGLFTVMKRDEDFEPTVLQLCAEHLTLDQHVERIMDGRTELIDDFMLALREHIDAEENGLFPAAAVGLSGDDWDEVFAATPHGHEHEH